MTADEARAELFRRADEGAKRRKYESREPVEQALSYSARGLSVFPCIASGPWRKRPLTKRGWIEATTDPKRIARWWSRWPSALIGAPTGRVNGFVVLDVDVKRGRTNGFDTLAELGYSVLPDTPMVHTASGGLHIYFNPPEPEIRNTAGDRGRGVGIGLDWRGEGGYVILAAPGSGYNWDRQHNFATTRLAEVPPGLLPREIRHPTPLRRPMPTAGLSRYAEAALDRACRAIINAPAGEQETTLNGESFSIGSLAGAGAIPEGFARSALIWAGRQMPTHNARSPWRPSVVEAKVRRAFTDGMRRPREVRHG